MRISAGLPRGVAALLFAAARRRRRLEARLAAALEAAGFSEVVLPIVDYLEPYEPLLTAASRGELYRFVDRDGELLALRADFTPALARLLAPMLAAQGDGGAAGGGAGDGGAGDGGAGDRAALALPLRLFYRGDVVRFEEERPGRQRELYQVGAELIGAAGEAAERDMLRLFLALLTAAAEEVSAGAGDGGAGEPPALRVVLGFAGALDRALAAAAAGGADPAVLARALVRRERAPLRRAGGVLLSVAEDGLPDAAADLGPEAAPRFERLVALAGEMAAEFPRVELAIDLAEFTQHVLDPALDTSLAPVYEPGSAAGGERAYYDGLVFHAYAGELALPAGAGGRYDRLFARLGAAVPAVGFSFGLERLLADGVRRRRPTRARPARVAVGAAAGGGAGGAKSGGAKRGGAGEGER